MHQLDSQQTTCTLFLLLAILSPPFLYIRHHFEHVEQVYHSLITNHSNRRTRGDGWQDYLDLYLL